VSTKGVQSPKPSLPREALSTKPGQLHLAELVPDELIVLGVEAEQREEIAHTSTLALRDQEPSWGGLREPPLPQLVGRERTVFRGVRPSLEGCTLFTPQRPRCFLVLGPIQARGFQGRLTPVYYWLVSMIQVI